MDYDFEAPTYVNFAEAMDDDEDEVSRYFDVEHEESFTRMKGTPGVILPEGPRDLPATKNSKSNTTEPARLETKTSHSQAKTPVKGRSPLPTRTSATKKTPGSIKKRSKTRLQTPGRVAASLNDLMLTPTSAVRGSTSSKRARDELDVTSSSPRKRSCSNAGIAHAPAAYLEVSPFAQNSERLVLEHSAKKSKMAKIGGVLSVIDGIEIAIPVEKQHAMETRADKVARDPPIRLRSRSISKVHTGNNSVTSNNLIRPQKRLSLPRGSTSENTNSLSSKSGKPITERFVSMAEATRQFHLRTPQRFRARPRNSPGVQVKGPVMALKATVPQSPALRVKNRTRPSTAMSREQLEEMELIKIRSHKIKPLPLPERILKPLNPVVKVEKKASTVPEPFNITEVKKKEPIIEPEPIKFTARPAPKKIFEGPIGIGEKKPTTLTDPKSPAFLASALKRWKAVNKRNTPLKATQKFTMKFIEDDSGLHMVKDKPVGHLGVPFMQHVLKGHTEVKPFSFEERDKEWMRRKEEKLKEVEEQMKQKPEFHAKPAPSYRMKSISPMIRSRTPGSQRKRTASEQPLSETQAAIVPQFKARPPTVLTKKPFEPVRPNRQLPLPDVTLASEIRAKDRELFDQQQLKRELELQALKQQVKAEKEKQEKEDIATLRKQAVHKPNPVPKVKPFQPQPSDKHLTNPSTPFCLKRSLRKMPVE